MILSFLFLGTDLTGDRFRELVSSLSALLLRDVFAIGGCWDQLAILLGHLATFLCWGCYAVFLRDFCAVCLEVAVWDLFAHFLRNLLTRCAHSESSIASSLSPWANLFILCGTFLCVCRPVHSDTLLCVHNWALLWVLCSAFIWQAGGALGLVWGLTLCAVCLGTLSFVLGYEDCFVYVFTGLLMLKFLDSSIIHSTVVSSLFFMSWQSANNNGSSLSIVSARNFFWRWCRLFIQLLLWLLGPTELWLYQGVYNSSNEIL